MTTIVDLPLDIIRHITKNYITIPENKISFLRSRKKFYDSFTEEELMEIRKRCKIYKFVLARFNELYNDSITHAICTKCKHAELYHHGHYKYIVNGVCYNFVSNSCPRKPLPTLNSYEFCKGCGVLVSIKNSVFHYSRCPKIYSDCEFCGKSFSAHLSIKSVKKDRDFPAHNIDTCRFNPNKKDLSLQPPPLQPQHSAGFGVAVIVFVSVVSLLGVMYMTHKS